MRENQLSACVLVMHNHQLDEQRANTRLNTIYFDHKLQHIML